MSVKVEETHPFVLLAEDGRVLGTYTSRKAGADAAEAQLVATGEQRLFIAALLDIAEKRTSVAQRPTVRPELPAELVA